MEYRTVKHIEDYRIVKDSEYLWLYKDIVDPSQGVSQRVEVVFRIKHNNSLIWSGCYIALPKNWINV